MSRAQRAQLSSFRSCGFSYRHAADHGDESDGCLGMRHFSPPTHTLVFCGAATSAALPVMRRFLPHLRRGQFCPAASSAAFAALPVFRCCRVSLGGVNSGAGDRFFCPWAPAARVRELVCGPPRRRPEFAARLPCDVPLQAIVLLRTRSECPLPPYLPFFLRA